MKPVKSTPLYKLVKESILTRIAEGEWAPGTFLPSEPALAKEYEVSHGTLRRALDELTREKRLTRYQGKGTAVALLDEDEALFQFFQIYNAEGSKTLPTSKNISITSGVGKKGGATVKEAAALDIPVGDHVIRIERVRLVAGKSIFNEHITLAASRFLKIKDMPLEQLPNTLYAYFQQKFSVTIASAKEKLRAVIASSEDVERLNIAEGTPMLAIERVSFDIKNNPIEYRTTAMVTDDYYYYSELKG
ncbi:MAG: GntR family transcriptional regulator [Halodesulfovibrio sp.]|uniref:GntR family transcriptional regulator n=1 Tax=Halodesulfovibrio sp. TaxID=1912772 RepID=UPI00359D1B0F